MKVTRLRMISIIALTSGALLAAGCVNDGSGETSLSNEQAAKVEARLLRAYTQVNGTPAQRRAFEFINYANAQSRLLVCMAKDGFQYPTARFVDPYPGWTSMLLPAPRQEAGDVSLAAAATRGFGIEAEVLASKALPQVLSAYLNLSRKQVAKCDVALNACSGSGSVPSASAEGLPSFVQPLSDELLAVMSQALNSAGIARDDEDHANYRDCMLGRGFQAGSMEAVVSQVAAAYGPFFNTVGEPVEGKPVGGAEWQRIVESERAAASADAECRAEDHRRYLAELDLILRTFEATHGAAIDSLVPKMVFSSCARRYRAGRMGENARNSEILNRQEGRYPMGTGPLV